MQNGKITLTVQFPRENSQSEHVLDRFEEAVALAESLANRAAGSVDVEIIDRTGHNRDAIIYYTLHAEHGLYELHSARTVSIKEMNGNLIVENTGEPGLDQDAFSAMNGMREWIKLGQNEFSPIPKPTPDDLLAYHAGVVMPTLTRSLDRYDRQTAAERRALSEYIRRICYASSWRIDAPDPDTNDTVKTASALARCTTGEQILKLLSTGGTS